MNPRLLVTLAVLTAATPLAGAAPGVPDVEGPDVPTVGTPVVVVTVFEDERFTCTESVRTRSINVPSSWDRIILEYTATPDGDPWDRLFGVAIGGVEVLRGTTPRTEMTLRKDITRYGGLLPPGGTAEVSLAMGTYVGSLLGTVRLEFYADEPTAALVRGPANSLPVVTWGSLNGSLQTIDRTVAFPDEAPTGATVELTISGHGNEEFPYGSAVTGARIFRVFVDETEITMFRALPYSYALLGFGNEYANTPCVGPGTDTLGDTVHPVMWWTAQRALDAAGVHLGVGEIPAFVAQVDAAHLALLTGARAVRIVQIGGGARWVTSLSFHLR